MIADGFLESKDADLAYFLETISDIKLSQSEEKGDQIARALWQSTIVEKFDGASAEAIACRFLLIADQIVYPAKCKQPDLEAIFSFCEAWHDWQSEVDGEHLAAIQAERSQSNLRKSGTARKQRKQKRLEIVKQFAEKLWASKPIYSNNASKTAATIFVAVNAALVANGEKPYTAASLHKTVGEILRPRD